MHRLPQPIRQVLDEQVDELRVQRMWRNISAKRARRPATRILQATGLAAAAVLLVVFLRGFSGIEIGPIKLASGARLTTLTAETSTEDASEVHFSDGSAVALSPGTRLEPLENNDHAVSLLLSRGRALFDVKHGGPRRWSIESGLATIEVVGTRFRIDRGENHVRVSVYRGIVLVKGERVPNRVARLTAGQHVDVYGPVSAPVPIVEAVPVTPQVVEIPAAVTERTRRLSNAWRSLAAEGEYSEAYESLGAEGLAREASGASSRDLLTLADVARLSGHPQEAVPPLERLLREHNAGADAALAAFTLGRISLDSLRDSDRAIASFTRCLDIGPPAGLVEDVYARLVEAHARAGHRLDAERVAGSYRERFPNGRRIADVNRWTAP